MGVAVSRMAGDVCVSWAGTVSSGMDGCWSCWRRAASGSLQPALPRVPSQNKNDYRLIILNPGRLELLLFFFFLVLI